MARTAGAARAALFALVATALVLAGAEVAARAANAALGGPLDLEDPFVGFYGDSPVWTPRKGEPGVMETSPRKMATGRFRYETFPRRKPAGEFRAFAFGGSTTFGVSLSGHDGPETAYPKQLEALLQAAMPDRKVRVINAGACANASYRDLKILREAARYEPDLLLVSSGNNEYMEPRFYRPLLERDPRVIALQKALYRSKAFLALKRGIVWARGTWRRGVTEAGADPENLDMFGRPMLPEEVDEERPGYTPNEIERLGFFEHFWSNVNAMADEAAALGAPLVLMNVPHNRPYLVRDVFPPFAAALLRGDFASVAALGLGEDALEAYAPEERDLIAWAARQEGGPGVASGYEGEYRARLRRRREPIDVFNLMVEQVAMLRGAIFVDAIATFEEERAAWGDDRAPFLFADSIHPTEYGYRLWAEAVVEALRRAGALGKGGA